MERGGVPTPPQPKVEMIRCLELEAQAAARNIDSELGVDGAKRLEGVANRTKIVVQILTAQQEIVRQLVFEPAAGNPTEIVGLGGEARCAAFKAIRERRRGLRPCPADAGSAVGQEVVGDEETSASASACKRINFGAEGS